MMMSNCLRIILRRREAGIAPALLVLSEYATDVPSTLRRSRNVGLDNLALRILSRQSDRFKRTLRNRVRPCDKGQFPIEVAKLRGKLEQLEQEHAREIKQLEEKIKGLEAIVKQTSPPPSSERTKPAAADERMDKDDLSLDAQGC
jgi:hypothetical protein